MLRYIVLPSNEFNFDDLQIALLNYIVAKEKNSNFLTIVDDISKEYIEGKEQEIIDILKKFAIDTEQKVYRKDNLSIYQRFATKLVEDKKAFICFCDEVQSKCSSCKKLPKEQIKNKLDSKEPYTIRLNHENREQIILQKNQIPTFDFASAIDNMIYNINTIVAKDSEDSSIKEQISILKLFDYSSEINSFYIKTSKTPTVVELLKSGFLPDAIINYAINLIYPTSKEVFYLPDAIKWLDISKLDSRAKSFNIDELKELNRKHLLKMDSKKLSSTVGFADSDIGELLKLFLKNLFTINELESKFKQIFKPKNCKNDIDSFKQISDIIKKAPMIDNFLQFKEYLVKKSNFSDTKVEDIIVELFGVKDIKEAKEVYPFIKSYILEVARCQ